MLNAQSFANADVATTRKRDMTRIEAAQYITDHWSPARQKRSRSSL
jgi:hypothetical protein